MARLIYHIPDTHDPVTCIAIGSATDPKNATNEQWAERDRTRRERKPLSAFLFSGQWNHKADLHMGGP